MVAHTNEIPLNTVGADSISARMKQTARTKQYGGAPTPTHIAGTGVLDCPFRYESKFFPRRTVRQLVARTPCPYNVYGGRCAAVLFCSRRLFYAGGYGIRPYGAEQNIICRGDHILAKQVCHEAKRNIESSVKNQRQEPNIWRRTDPHTHCRDRRPRLSV